MSKQNGLFGGMKEFSNSTPLPTQWRTTSSHALFRNPNLKTMDILLADFVATLQQKAEEQIQLIEESGQSPIDVLKASIDITEANLDALRIFLIDYEFKDIAEEILYFKTLYPQVLSRSIYYISIFNTEMGKPEGGDGVLKAYYDEKLKHIHNYFVRHDDFYRYYRSGADFFDRHYFTRAESDNLMFKEEYTFAIDTRTCTTHSYKLSKVLAYERFENYLMQQKLLLDTPGTKPAATSSSFRWTGSKVALIELIYGLVYSGNINNGALQIKDFVEFVEQAFNIRLGNYSRTKQEIYSRKNDLSYFDVLKKRFQQGMEDADDRYN